MANVVEIVLRGVDQYSRGFTTAIRDMNSLKTAASSLYTTFLGAATTAAGALTTLTVQAIRNADEMGKMAQRTAMPVETLSRLMHAAEMTEVGAEALEKAIRGLSKSMGEALKDGSSDAARMFQALGVTLTDGQGRLRSTDAILLQLADRFAQFEENAAKGDLAMKLFGKSGTAILPMLDEGAAAIRKFGDEAIIVTEDMARQADELGKNLQRLKMAGRELGNALATEALPHLNAFAAAAVEAKNNTTFLRSAVEVLMTALKLMYLGLVGVISGLEIFGNFLGHTALLFAENFKGAIELGIIALREFGKILGDAWQMLGAIGRAVADLGGALVALAQRDFARASQLAKESLAEIAMGAFDASEKVDASLKTIAGAYSGYVAKAKDMTLGLWRDFVADALQDAISLVAVVQGLFPKMAGLPEPGAGPGAKPESPAVRQAKEDASEILKIKGLTDADYLKMEQALNRALAIENARALRERIQGQQAALGATANLFGSLASLSAAFGKKNFALTQAFSIAQAIVTTAAGVARALQDYQFPYSIIVGALVAAAGAAQIATIAAASPKGIAHGGLDYVPSTGTYILEQGEAVLQPRQNQAIADMLEGRGRNATIVLELDGIVLGKVMTDLARSGRIEIPARAIV